MFAMVTQLVYPVTMTTHFYTDRTEIPAYQA